MYKWKPLSEATSNVQGAIARSLKYNISGMLYTVHAIGVDGNNEYTIADCTKGYHYIYRDDIEYLDEPKEVIRARIENFDRDEFHLRAKNYPMA
jgi:hypothetical protein